MIGASTFICLSAIRWSITFDLIIINWNAVVKEDGSGSQQTFVAVGVVRLFVVVADDDVVEEGDTEDFRGFPEPFCDAVVLFGRGRVAGRVVVDGDDGRAVGADGGPENFAGMDQAGVEEADSDGFGTDDMVFGVEEDNFEAFLVVHPHLVEHEVDNVGGGADDEFVRFPECV